MAGPVLTSCCRCQTLRVGSIVAGVLSILLSIVSLVIMITIPLQYKTKLFDSWLSQETIKILIGFNWCMTVLISAIMIVGVVKRNYYLMLPWVILGVMLIIGFLLVVLYSAIVAFIDGFLITGICVLAVGLLLVAIYTYMWAVVYSHFMVLRDESKRGKYNRQPYRR